MKRSLFALCVLAGFIFPCVSSATNIVVNGSFELLYPGQVLDPTVHWNTYTEIPGWRLSSGPHIEIQENVLYTPNSAAAEGSRWLELDGDNTGPGLPGQGQYGSSTVYQDLATDPGALYLLTFAFSPRPGIDSNLLQVMWNGVQVGDLITANGAGNADLDWTYFSFYLHADSGVSRLSFQNLDIDNSLGTFVDDVSVSKVTDVPEPATVLLLGGSLLVGAVRRRGARV